MISVPMERLFFFAQNSSGRFNYFFEKFQINGLQRVGWWI